jgi:hypothetical protein
VSGCHQKRRDGLSTDRVARRPHVASRVAGGGAAACDCGHRGFFGRRRGARPRRRWIDPRRTYNRGTRPAPLLLCSCDRARRNLWKPSCCVGDASPHLHLLCRVFGLTQAVCIYRSTKLLPLDCSSGMQQPHRSDSGGNSGGFRITARSSSRTQEVVATGAHERLSLASAPARQGNSLAAQRAREHLEAGECSAVGYLRNGDWGESSV